MKPRRRKRSRRAAPPFASLDFPEREMLCPSEAAKCLGCSVQHIYNLILEGQLRAINISRPNRSQRCFARIPIEAWRKFLSDRAM
jgi:excisionase family DNA binding protein